MVLALALACAAPDVPEGLEHAEREDTAPPDSGVPVDGAWDVIVVGSGPAGTAAALTAREAGRSVLLLEREETPGRGLILGGLGFGVGTPWQEAARVTDSVDAAQAEWSTITGVSGDTPGVREYLAGSAETLSWLEGHGMRVSQVAGERDAGLVPRIHHLDWTHTPAGDGTALLAAFDGDLRTGVEVTAPLMEDGAVVGVRWTDRATGERGASAAGAVVLATGGFLRDLDEVARVAPAMTGREVVFETNPSSDGGGLPFLRAVGAGSLSPENIGVYVHSIADPWAPGYPEDRGEALIAVGHEAGILVDATGARFVNEDLQRSLDLFDALPEGDVFAVLSAELADAVLFLRPYYNWSNPPEEETAALDEVLAASDQAFEAEDLADVAVLAGVDPAGLADSVEAWNIALATAYPDPFDRDLSRALPLEGDRWVLLRITPGLAKNFGGVATDVEARVLDARGVAIPGLYGAGEVAGMLIGGGGGDGWSGSVTACFWGGRIAGAGAAAYAP